MQPDADQTTPAHVQDAIRTLASFCIEQGVDRLAITLRNGPLDPDGGVTDWRVEIAPAPGKDAARA